MNNELKLAQPPQRKSVQQQAKEAGERAYERSYRRAAIDTAKAEGAAAGAAAAVGSEPAVERAKARALGTTTPATSSPSIGLQKTSSVPEFVEADVRGTRRRIPSAVYDLPAAQQRQFFDDLEAKEREKEGESYFDNVALAVLDRVDAMGKRITTLESQLGTALAVIERLQQRETEKAQQVEVVKSEALVQAESQAAQTVVNMASTTSDGNGLIQRIGQAKDEFTRWAEGWFNKFRPMFSEMEGRLNSRGQLFMERGNALEAKADKVDNHLARVDVQLVELEGRTDAIGNPITRAEVQQMTRDAVQQELSGQITNEKIKQVIRENFIPAAPSTSIDALNLPDPEFAPMGDNATERAVNRALKKGGRR